MPSIFSSVGNRSFIWIDFLDSCGHAEHVPITFGGKIDAFPFPRMKIHLSHRSAEICKLLLKSFSGAARSDNLHAHSRKTLLIIDHEGVDGNGEAATHPTDSSSDPPLTRTRNNFLYNHSEKLHIIQINEIFHNRILFVPRFTRCKERQGSIPSFRIIYNLKLS